MLKSVLQHCLATAGCLILLIALIFPLVTFKISVSTAIFPAIDIIVIYYFTCYHKIGIVRVLLLSAFIDQIYGLPLGCSTLAYVCGQLSLKLADKWFLIKGYINNVLIFCCYCFVVFSVRYLTFLATEKGSISSFELIFQYLTSICSYPLVRALLDRICPLFNFKAKDA